MRSTPPRILNDRPPDYSRLEVNLMKPTFVLFVFVTVMVTSNALGGDEAKKDLAKIQGDWKLVSLSVEGRLLPEVLLNKVKGGAVGLSYAIKGDKFLGVIKGDKILADGEKVIWTIRLDPKKNPKAIELLHVAPDEGKTTPGIYSFEGDTLKIYFPNPNVEDQKRPTDFANNRGVMGYILKRQ